MCNPVKNQRSKDSNSVGIPPQGDYFPPGAVLDHVLGAQLKHALKNDFTQPYRMRIMDKGHRCVGEVLISIKDDEVFMKPIALEADPVGFPVTTTLTDKEGRTHSELTESKEMEKWMRDHYETSRFLDGGVLRVFFSGDRPNFSQEVFCALAGLLIAAVNQGLDPPFTGEVWDTEDKLFDRRPIAIGYNGQFQSGSELACCGDLKFPVTIKVIDRNGVGLSRLVKRTQ